MSSIRTVNQTTSYLKQEIKFILNNQEYGDLIVFIEEIQTYEFDKKTYKSWFSACVEAFLVEINKIEESEQEQSMKLDEIFHCLKTLPIDKTDDNYLLLFNRTTKFYDAWDSYINFLNWWDVKK